MHRWSAKRYVWCFMGFEAVQECPTPLDKVLVLEEMIFPQCEKLGQTISVRTREIARTLHAAVRPRFSLWLSVLPLGQEVPCHLVHSCPQHGQQLIHEHHAA